METTQPKPMDRWVQRRIKTDCGRAKYAELAARPGAWARIRLAWFVLIAAIRDWPLPDGSNTEMERQGAADRQERQKS